MKRFTSLLVLLFGLGMSTLAFAAKELMDPPPVGIPAGISEKELVKQIKKAFVGRNWTVEKVEDGSIIGTLYIRAHVARVSANYDKEKVTFTYIASENLDYKEKKGKRLIHKNYNSWVANVRNDLHKNLQLEAMELEE